MLVCSKMTHKPAYATGDTCSIYSGNSAEELSFMGRCGEHISYETSCTEYLGTEKEYENGVNYKKMLFLCDIALGTGSCPLSLHVQAIRVICESLYYYELRTDLGYNCAEPGEIAASKLNLPSCLLAEIVNEIRNTVMVHYEHYVEPFIPSINP